MINLLPADVKQSYRYAYKNTRLVRWLSATIVVLLGLVLIGGSGWLAVHSSLRSTNNQAAALEQGLKVAKLDETNQRVTDISNSLKLSQKVLSQEILFSKLLKQMATALPRGANLTGLNISEISANSALDVTVDADSYNTATQVQANLSDPDNQIFASADIQNIACDPSSATNPNYPCKISLRAQFARDNPFLFINQKQVKS